MKIAITGKGGVGKTTISAILAKYFANLGYKVIAIDADPDMNLAPTLGYKGSVPIVPIVEMKKLIQERTGINESSGYGAYFKLNPKVDDIPEKYAVTLGDSEIEKKIKVIVMGTVKSGGAGCICPENVFLKALLSHTLVLRREAVIVDMVAGIEHLGRGTLQGIETLFIVVDTSRRSLETAERIEKLAADLGIKKVFVIGNRIVNDFDKSLVVKYLNKSNIAGFILYNENLFKASVSNEPASIDEKLRSEIELIISKTGNEPADDSLVN